MSNTRKLTIAVVAVALVAAMLGGTAYGRAMLNKLYVAVACDGGGCGD